MAPIQNDGTISPPRNPARMVSTVSTSFQKKSSVLTFPCSIACAISPVPAPHVVGGSEKLCDHDNCNAGNNNADIDVFQIFRIKAEIPFSAMQNKILSPAQQSATIPILIPLSIVSAGILVT